MSVNGGRLVWLSIEKAVERYVVLTDDGHEAADPVLGPKVKNALVGIRQFFAEHGLLTTPQFDDAGTRLVLGAARAEDAVTVFEEYTGDINASRFLPRGHSPPVGN